MGFLYMLGERCFECFPEFGAFPRAKNRALDRAFGALLCAMLSFVQTSCSRLCFLMLSSWTKSWFLVLSLVPKIVLFGALPRAKNRALDRAFWCSLSCQKSCFLVLSFVPEIVLFGAFPRAKNCALDRAFWCSLSCQKSCSGSCSLLQLLG